MKNILITLCARGGSKGIPGKNIKPLNDLPLIAYTIYTANNFAKVVDANVDITLSTDALDIQQLASEYGLITEYLRPSSLADDFAGKLSAIIHVKKYEEIKRDRQYDYLIDLDVSSPLRTVEDLLSGLQLLQNNHQALNLFSVNIANRNPYFNMVEETDIGFYGISKKNVNIVLSRQTTPLVYELNASFYIYTKSFFDQNISTVITDKSLIYIMPHLCFDLDHEIDFDFMEYLIRNNKLNFKL